MVRAMSLDPEPYIPEDDRNADEQTTFYLKNLSHQKWGVLMRQIGGKDGDAINLCGNSASEILKATLTGWDNFLDGNGTPVPFDSNMDKNLNRLSAGLRMELALEIINRNQMSKETEKN